VRSNKKGHDFARYVCVLKNVVVVANIRDKVTGIMACDNLVGTLFNSFLFNKNRFDHFPVISGRSILKLSILFH
jgi:hypothetical protein